MLCCKGNLREASKSGNAANRARNSKNKAGFKGVSLHRGKYLAKIMKDGRLYDPPMFPEPSLLWL
jgi:hypothetical protein